MFISTQKISVIGNIGTRIGKKNIGNIGIGNIGKNQYR